MWIYIYIFLVMLLWIVQVGFLLFCYFFIDIILCRMADKANLSDNGLFLFVLFFAQTTRRPCLQLEEEDGSVLAFLFYVFAFLNWKILSCVVIALYYVKV